LTIKAITDYKRDVNDKKPYKGPAKKKGKPYRRRRRPSGGGKPSPQKKNIFGKEKFINSYFSFYEQYLAARRKYFEAFGRGKSTKKLEENYFRSVDKLRKFEDSLTPEQIVIFHKYFPNLNPEKTYCENRGIEDIGKVEVPVDAIRDPHLLASQIESDYEADTEESVGTMEDYKAYKGL
jgi:hypothetical protein